jgi:hypothetical protein
MLVNKWKTAGFVLLALSMAGQDAAGADLSPIPYLIDDVSRLPAEAARIHAYVTTPFFPHELDYRQIP